MDYVRIAEPVQPDGSSQLTDPVRDVDIRAPGRPWLMCVKLAKSRS